MPGAAPMSNLAPVDQQRLLQQIMSMSQEQIDALPPSHKAQVLALRSKMMGGG
jgi:cleavage stimulation factor subunit 2